MRYPAPGRARTVPARLRGGHSTTSALNCDYDHNHERRVSRRQVGGRATGSIVTCPKSSGGEFIVRIPPGRKSGAPSGLVTRSASARGGSARGQNRPTRPKTPQLNDRPAARCGLHSEKPRRFAARRRGDRLSRQSPGSTRNSGQRRSAFSAPADPVQVKA